MGLKTRVSKEGGIGKMVYTPIKEWSVNGIMTWIQAEKILEPMSKKQRETYTDYFVEIATKHQDTTLDRKLYRYGLGLVSSRSPAYAVGGKNYKRFVDLK